METKIQADQVWGMKPKRESFFLYLDLILSRVDGTWYKQIMTIGKNPYSLMIVEPLHRRV